MASSIGSGYVSRSGSGNGAPSATSFTIAISASRPFPLRALVPTTGMPMRQESLSRSIRMRFFFASSIRFTHKTTLPVISITCSARIRLRSRHVASATTTVTSVPPKQMKSRAISSSAEFAISE